MLAVGVHCHTRLLSLSCPVCFISLVLQWGVPGLWERGSSWLRQLRPDQDLGVSYTLVPDLGCSVKGPYFQVRLEVLGQPSTVGGPGKMFGFRPKLPVAPIAPIKSAFG